MIEAIVEWMERIYDLMLSATQISPLIYALVLAGGMASALSPCYVPVLAMFGGYVAVTPVAVGPGASGWRSRSS